MVTLKPNMYVRYKYHNEQKIGKVDFIIYNEFADENFIGLTNNEGIFEGKILKASFNIIDLIEVGDYVNGKIVDEIALIEDVWFVKTKVSNIDNYDYLPERLIEDIVTKEQFQNCKYVVERDK